MKQLQCSKIVEESGQSFIQEGKAKILTKKITDKYEEQVFYNPAQIFNRDFTVLAIDTFARQQAQEKNFQPLRIVDALSASGLRSIRFAKELDPTLISEVYANDISKASITLIQENVNHNDCADRIKVNHMDANQLLCNSAFRLAPSFQIIDLDPYGSVSPFLDSAILACNQDEGKPTLLCITCTDSRVLCGPDQQKCFSTYGTARAKTQFFAENGIRTLLYTVGQCASRVAKLMTPVLSIYGEFYLRIFVKIQRNKAGCHQMISKIGNLLYCSQCSSHWCHPYGQKEEKEYKINKSPFRSQCQLCQGNLRMNGPVWLGQINDKEFMEDMLKNIQHHDFYSKDKVLGKIQGILEQIEFEEMAYSYNVNWMCSMLHCSNISKKEILSGFNSLGYSAIQSYLQKDEYKTNAPPDVVYDIIKKWKKDNCAETYLKNVEEGTAAYKILTSEIVHQPKFDLKVKISDTKKFYPNPQKNWGPKQKAVERKLIEPMLEKKIKND